MGHLKRLRRPCRESSMQAFAEEKKCDQNRVLVGKVREKCSLKFFVYVFEGRGREK